MCPCQRMSAIVHASHPAPVSSCNLRLTCQLFVHHDWSKVVTEAGSAIALRKQGITSTARPPPDAREMEPYMAAPRRRDSLRGNDRIDAKSRANTILPFHQKRLEADCQAGKAASFLTSLASPLGTCS